jgi:hypothetical protein
MAIRIVRVGFLCCSLFSFSNGCQPKPQPQAAPLTAGPYSECRSVIEWIRIKNNDPDATILRWGPREEQIIDGAPREFTSVLIEVHYQATIGKVGGGRWKQTIRVEGRHIQEDTPPLAE